MSRNTEPGEKYLDGRDLLRRLEELVSERSDLIEDDDTEALEAWNEENGEELAALEAIENEISRDAHLILDSAFEDYARELASDIHGREVDNASWPFDCATRRSLR